jgi:hypothetical protein
MELPYLKYDLKGKLLHYDIKSHDTLITIFVFEGIKTSDPTKSIFNYKTLIFTVLTL